MSKSLKKKSHWTSKVHESVIGRNPEGQLGFELKGGAENGQFPYLGEVKPGKVAYESGSKLVSEELLLEVNETPVAGLTIRDVLAVIKHCKDPLRLKCVKQGGIVDKDLRHYLNLRFQKGSVDHELQQIIRDNLYLRTVPSFFIDVGTNDSLWAMNVTEETVSWFPSSSLLPCCCKPDGHMFELVYPSQKVETVLDCTESKHAS